MNDNKLHLLKLINSIININKSDRLLTFVNDLLVLINDFLILLNYFIY